MDIDRRWIAYLKHLQGNSQFVLAVFYVLGIGFKHQHATCSGTISDQFQCMLDCGERATDRCPVKQ